MNEKNLVHQHLLTESIRKQREGQIENLKIWIKSFKTTSASREPGVYACVALYLALIAEWLETQIAIELRYLTDTIALSEENEHQAECRGAMCFGTLDGAAQLGQLSNELIHRSQRTLGKAGLIAFSERPLKQHDPLHKPISDEGSGLMDESSGAIEGWEG